jgi:hydrogenase expression/formation protein HypC
MCLAVPLRVVAVSGRTARARSAGLEIDVALDLVEGVDPGDYVIVHAGYAIQRLSEPEALETLAILERMERS